MADDIANTLDGSFILFFMQTVPDECVILVFLPTPFPLDSVFQ